MTFLLQLPILGFAEARMPSWHEIKAPEWPPDGLDIFYLYSKGVGHDIPTEFYYARCSTFMGAAVGGCNMARKRRL